MSRIVSRMLARLRIGPKLLLAPGLVLALLIVSSSGAYWAMVRQNQSLEAIALVRAARIKEATELVAEAQGAHARAYQLLTYISASVSQARIAALEADIDRRHAALEGRFARLAGQSLPASVERRLLAQSETAHALYVKAVLEVIELAGGDQSIAANAMVRADQAFERAALRLAQLAGHEQQLSEAAVRGAAAEFTVMSRMMALLVAASVLLSLFITVAVRRSLLREVGAIGQSALELGSGNLTVPVRRYGSDEISETSRTLDASIRTLNLTLKDILDSARSIGAASRDIGEIVAAVRQDSGIVQMDHMTGPNSALVQEAAEAAARLQAQALNLSQSVASFRLDEGAAPAPPHLWLASKRE